MKVLRKEGSPRYRRSEGITSYLLVSSRTCGANLLTTTLVEIEPGGSQRIHHHRPEQVYMILAGSGDMTVDGTTRYVGPGDCVFIPSGKPHGIVNRGMEVLRYFSAAAPAFDPVEIATSWPLPSEHEESGTRDS